MERKYRANGTDFPDDFPLKNPAQTWPGGQQNAFVARFTFLTALGRSTM